MRAPDHYLRCRIRYRYQSDPLPKAEVLGEIFSYALNTDSPSTPCWLCCFLFSAISPVHHGPARAVRDQETGGNAMDFDDLLALWLRLMREHEPVREHYQRRFQFVLVDEYQDTNRLQGDLIDLIAARHKNVMVVGDDAQSIYAWRGANFQNILQFPRRYPGAKVYKIETNYRSTPEILDLANAAIRANLQQFSKELAAARRPVLSRWWSPAMMLPSSRPLSPTRLGTAGGGRRPQ